MRERIALAVDELIAFANAKGGTVYLGVEADGITYATTDGKCLRRLGKEKSIHRLLPQAEVIYLHYAQDNLEEYDARLDIFNATTIKIEAQVYAKELYEKVGFVQKSKPFLEDGIPHINGIYRIGFNPDNNYHLQLLTNSLKNSIMTSRKKLITRVHFASN